MTRIPGRWPESSALAEIEPTPDSRALEFSIECRLSRTAIRGEKHLVTIHPDWSVTTPHDLESERVAAAFGGFTSCLTLVDKTIPAFRAALPVLARLTRIPLRRDKRGHWRLPLGHQVANCCSRKEFTTIDSAAGHLRSASHLARAHGVPQWQLATVMSEAESAWGSWEGDPPPTSQLDGLVRELGGVAELWQAGIHPNELRELAAAAVAVQEPLPTSYFLGMVYGTTDPDWIFETVRHRPDADTAAWLAWLDSPNNVANGLEWGAWLQLGLPRSDVQVAVEARLRADQVITMAHDTDQPISVVAKNVVAWAKADCFPTARQFEMLKRYGVNYSDPSRTAIDVLVSEVGSRGLRTAPERTAYSRTELAVMLMILGTRRAVLHAVIGGIRSTEDLDSYIHR